MEYTEQSTIDSNNSSHQNVDTTNIDIISDNILFDDSTVNKIINDNEMFLVSLKAPYSLKRKGEYMITYLNEGQKYEMHIACKIPIITPEKYKTLIKLGFDKQSLDLLREKTMEKWQLKYPKKDPFKLEVTGNNSNCKITKSKKHLGVYSLEWNSNSYIKLLVSFNCLSSDFNDSASGKEGVTLKLKISTFKLSQGDILKSHKAIHRSFCNIKVFKLRGAERKYKAELNSYNKLKSHFNDLIIKKVTEYNEAKAVLEVSMQQLNHEKNFNQKYVSLNDYVSSFENNLSNLKDSVQTDLYNVQNSVKTVQNSVQNELYNVQNSVENVQTSVKEVQNSMQNVQTSVKNVQTSVKNVHNSVQNELFNVKNSVQSVRNSVKNKMNTINDELIKINEFKKEIATSRNQKINQLENQICYQKSKMSDLEKELQDASVKFKKDFFFPLQESLFIQPPIKYSPSSEDISMEKSSSSKNEFKLEPIKRYKEEFEEFDKCYKVKNTNIKINDLSTNEDIFQWLDENNFSSFKEYFKYYTGLDILKLTKKEFIQICGASEGYRMFNRLDIKVVLAPVELYLCKKIKSGNSDKNDAFKAVYLKDRTLSELKSKLKEFLDFDTEINNIYFVKSSGIKIIVQEADIMNLKTEKSFFINYENLSDGTRTIYFHENI